MKKTVLIAVVITILLTIIAGMGLMLAGILPFGSAAEQPEGEPEQVATSAFSPPPAPTYIRMDPAFTVSFADEEEAQFLQLDISVTTSDGKVPEALAQHMPAIRNALVLLFSSQKAADLKSREGKEKLRQQALEEINRVLEVWTGKAGINDVFFTSFVMQ